MIQPLPSRDPVIEEIHCTREKIAASFDYNIAAIMEDARKRQAESRKVEWQPNSNDSPTKPATSSPTQATTTPSP